MRPLPFCTFNAQGVSDPADVVVKSVRTVLPGIAVAALQEVAPARLRAHLSSLVGVHQDRSSLARAGSAVVWSKDRCHAIDRGVEPLAHPEAGDHLRTRSLAWVDLRIDGGEVIRFGSCHRPLEATGDQPEFDTALARFADGSPHPLAIGLDANTRRWAALAFKTRLRPKNVGIDGFLLSRSLFFPGSAVRLGELGEKSDHDPVVTWVA